MEHGEKEWSLAKLKALASFHKLISSSGTRSNVSTMPNVYETIIVLKNLS